MTKKAVVFDFNKFDPAADSRAGAWLHLRDPYNGAELLYADEDQKLPVRLKVLGPETDEVRAFNTEVERIRGNSAETITDDADAELCAAMVIGWENIGVGDDTTFSPENAVALMKRFTSIRKQVVMFAMTLKNFKGSANTH